MAKRFILLQALSYSVEKASTRFSTWIIDVFEDPYKATEKMNDFIKERLSELIDLDGVTDITFGRCYSVFAFSCCQLNFNLGKSQSIEYYAVMELKEKEQA